MLFVQHIRSQGYESKFYETAFTYYDHEGMVYWTMGEPLGKTTAIYRCRKEDTYESRRQEGTLPEANGIDGGISDAMALSGSAGSSDWLKVFS